VTADIAEDLPAVRLRNVSYSYPGSVEAVQDLSLDLAEGSITAIVGPSGCGKSTLLSLIAALVRPSAGAIERAASRGDGRLPVSLVFQKDTLLPWLTVEQNAGLAFRFRSGASVKRAERADWIRHLLELAKLAEFRSAYPHQLSGGMRRRLAFVTAVAPRPRLLLLDEPFSSVDEPTRVAIHQDVLNIVRESMMTTLIVTHDLAEAISLSDRVVLLTRRPARIAEFREMPFGRDRDVLQLRQSPQYLSEYGELWSGLSREILSDDNRSER
jgi:NitT/TauT family transport system ATP-binding protein